MKSLHVYRTHIQIYPYEQGDYQQLEDQCSTIYYQSIHGRTIRKQIPMGFRIDGEVLKIPRGMNLEKLRALTGSLPTMEAADKALPMKREYQMTSGPRDEKQNQTIAFLLGRGEFRNTKRYSQLAVIVQPGFGKTYCSIAAMLAMNKKTIIILHRDNIREQWLETLRAHTTMDMKRVVVVEGTDRMRALAQPKNLNKYDVYLVLHQTITAYERVYDNDGLGEWFQSLGFGLKIIDEVHFCFQQTIETDLAANVEKNIYLTATFTRSDPREQALFQRVFANTARFGEELEVVKNAIYNMVFYTSNPPMKEQMSLKTFYGFSAHRFADYAFHRDPNETIVGVFLQVLEKALVHEGRILVVIPKIAYVESVKTIVERKYPHIKVGSVHSKNTKKHNEEIKLNAEIIISTISSLGTGSDIKRIRSLIIMEPFASKLTAKQLIGRLRPYKEEDSYVYELIDMGLEPVCRMVSKRLPFVRSLVKDVKSYKL